MQMQLVIFQLDFTGVTVIQLVLHIPFWLGKSGRHLVWRIIRIHVCYNACAISFLNLLVQLLKQRQFNRRIKQQMCNQMEWSADMDEEK